MNKALAAVLLVLAVTAVAVYAQEEMDGKKTEDIPKADLTELIQFCKNLKFKYMPILKFKHDRHIEHELMTSAGTLGKWLYQAEHKELQKHPNEFTCEEAHTIVEHSSAKAFLDLYDEFSTHAGPAGKTNDDVIKAFTELRGDLLKSRLVNREALEDVDDIVDDLRTMGKWHSEMKRHYNNMMKSKQGCEKDFQDFLKEVNEIYHDKAPNYVHVYEGVQSLVAQCQDDEELNAEL